MADFQPVNLAQIYGAADDARMRNMQFQNAQLEMARRQRAQQEDDAVKAAYAFTPEGKLDEKATLAQLYRAAPQKAYEFQQSILARDAALAKQKREDTTAQLGNAEKKYNLMKSAAGAVLANPTLDNAILQTMTYARMTGDNVDGEIANLQSIGNNPDAIRRWAAGHSLNAEQLLPRADKMDNGQFMVDRTIDPLTGLPTEVSRTQKMMTPGEVASNQVSKDQLAVSQGNLRVAQSNSAETRRHNTVTESQGGSNKPPQGYRWAANGTDLEAITGGPGDKLGESQQKQIIGVNNLKSAIAEYQNQLKNWGKLDALNPDARAAMGTKYNNMMLQAKEAYNLGVLNGPDFDILTSVITDPRSMKGAITSNDALNKQASELDRIMGGIADVASQRRQPQQNAKTPPQGGPIATVKSDADFNALPKGTRFKAPDGTIRIKP